MHTKDRAEIVHTKSMSDNLVRDLENDYKELNDDSN